MSVQYCLCVSRIQCTQYSVSVYSVGSVIQHSMQVVFRVASVQFLKHSVYRVESVAYIVSGVQCQLGYSLQCSWSAYYYSVSVVFGLVFSCQWGSVYSVQCQFSVCSVQSVYCSVGHSPSVLFSVCSVQSTGCSPRVCHVHVMFRVHTLKVLCPCAVLEYEHPVNHRGSLEDKICKIIIFLNPLISQCTMTHVLVRIYFRQVLTGGTYLSVLGSQQGILISASTVSHCGSPVWKNGSCSEHQCIGLLEEHCSNYIINLCQC